MDLLFVAVGTFQPCVLGFQGLRFGFSFGRGRSFLLRFECHLGERQLDFLIANGHIRHTVKCKLQISDLL